MAGKDGVLTPTDLFLDSPAGLALYRAVADVVAAVGEAEVRVTSEER